MDHPSGIDRKTLARQVRADVDRAAPLFARILLIRALRRSVWVARDMIADCGPAGELAVPSATTRRLARILAPAHDADRDLTPAIAAVERLESAQRRADNAYARYSAATDPDIGRHPEREDAAGREWEQARRSVGDAEGDMPVDLGTGTVGSVLLDRAFDRVFQRGLGYEIRHYHFAREPERAWRGRVAGVLLDAARVTVKRGRVAAKRGRVAGEDSLADTLRAGRRALLDAKPRAWARHAAEHLEETAVPVLARDEPLTADTVTAIRLAALCLAHEPEARRIGVIGDAYCTLFASVAAGSGPTGSWVR